ncbi:signal-transduction histidine kinase senX3 [Clostridium oryzae]|uniref:histidine kinase n=2 Tax=Clostridium oryzae TaxID=1450648 RepID=A0A1V4INK0_9CLOT|nr:signal-transduction histidine kinase senX3 [Clostridium oryzae]
MSRYDSKKSSRIILIGCFVLLIGILDTVLVKIQYDNYREKISIICMMLNEENTIDKASKILKTGQIKDISKGKEILYRYGYKLHSKNALFHKFELQSMMIICISFIILIALFLAILIINLINKKRMRKEIEIIEKLISDYKQGIVDTHNEIVTQFDDESLKKLYYEISSFGDALRLLNEREMMEKESTKSLVSDISHQLKTPVAALKTSFEILQQDLSAEEKTEFTERCKIQILGIENLLGALINISRMEAGMIDIMLDNQCVFDTILASINRVYEKAEGKNIEIEFEAEEELKDLYIPHDKKWLCEAFINIFENAIKYSSENKNIIIRMLKLVTFLRIEICDEGIGIAKEEYNQIFKRFYRGNSPAVKKQPGSGIGLYLTREIISRHHGTIRVESGENKKGSKFIIQLPCQ